MDRNNTCFLPIGKIMHKGDVFIMIMRFGYVSHAMALWDCSPAKTMTFTSFQKLSKQEREDKLYDVTRQNLEHTIRILHYNIAHEIPLYPSSHLQHIPKSSLITSDCSHRFGVQLGH